MTNNERLKSDTQEQILITQEEIALASRKRDLDSRQKQDLTQEDELEDFL